MGLELSMDPQTLIGVSLWADMQMLMGLRRSMSPPMSLDSQSSQPSHISVELARMQQHVQESIDV
jgi:hypothetical protein